MSYSFSVTAPSRAEAKDAVSAKFDEVVESQPVHEADREAANLAAGMFVDALDEPNENEMVSLSVTGSVTTDGNGNVRNASLSVWASIAPKVE